MTRDPLTDPRPGDLVEYPTDALTLQRDVTWRTARKVGYLLRQYGDDGTKMPVPASAIGVTT